MIPGVSSLSDRFETAFVTGVSSGLGRAFTEMLLAGGVRVWGTARSHERLRDLAGREGFTPLLLDLANVSSIHQAFGAASNGAGGRIDVVINNAGYGVFGPFAELGFEAWEEQILAALAGTGRLAHLAVRQMLAANRGTLVNVSSVAVDHPLPYMCGYNVVKAGLSALSESLIFETSGTGVSVIDLRPGDYRTSFNQSMQSTTAPFAVPVRSRVESAWKTLGANLAASPEPSRAAADLRKALLRGRSGTVYTGTFFQTRLAPLFSRLAPATLRRAVAARYFGAV